VLLEASAVVFSAVTASSCDFFEFTQKAGNVPLSQLLPQETADVNATSSGGANNGEVVEAGFGMLQWSPNFLGCTDYADRAGLGTAFRTGQAGALMAVSFGLLAALLNVTELLCCRFVCAKVLACGALIVALVGQALTFVLYASDVCLHRDNAVYACRFGSGCAWSIAALLCFLLSSLLVCPTPKPDPLCKQVCDQTRHNRGQQRENVSDPCCYCFRKKKDGDDDNDVGKEKEEEEDETKKKKQKGDVEEGNDDDDDDEGSVYNDTVTDVPLVANGVGNRSSQRPPLPLPLPPPSYPQEVYTRSSRMVATDSSTQTPMYDDPPRYRHHDDDDHHHVFSSAVSVPPAVVSYYHPSSAPPPAPTTSSSSSQYHYYAPPRAAAPPQSSSFANAEVMDGDLFFDSKTV
jgi:hypothetical protein